MNAIVKMSKITGPKSFTLSEIKKREGIYHSEGFTGSRVVVIKGSERHYQTLFVCNNEIEALNEENWINEKFVEINESISITFTPNK